MPYKAMKPLRYGGMNYSAGDIVPATERDAKVLKAVRSLAEVDDDEAPDAQADAEPKAKRGTYQRRDMRAKP
ncbi:MAG: hypothetical protein ACRCYZ_06940 [Alphaproteobacteria bacterium]